MNKTYVCDPARNTDCTSGLCFENGAPFPTFTDDVRFALRDFLGAPVEIVDNDFEGGTNGNNHRQTKRQ